MKYPKEKFKVLRVMKKKLLLERESSDSDESEIIAQLKEKIESTTKRSEKVLVVMVLQKSWTIRKVQEEFGASNYMVRKAKELVKEKGILSTPNPEPGHTLPTETIDLAWSFYKCDEVSRMMPGCKHFVSGEQKDESMFRRG